MRGECGEKLSEISQLAPIRSSSISSRVAGCLLKNRYINPTSGRLFAAMKPSNASPPGRYAPQASGRP